MTVPTLACIVDSALEPGGDIALACSNWLAWVLLGAVIIIGVVGIGDLTVHAFRLMKEQERGR